MSHCLYLTPRQGPAPLGLVLLLLACGSGSSDATSPPPPRPKVGIEIIAGGSRTDTIGANISGGLQVMVRDANGHAMPGVPVLFSSLPTPVPHGWSVYLATDRLWGAHYYLTDTTNSLGVAGVYVQFVGVTPNGGVAISVPNTAFVDTARYIVQAGQPASALFTVHDTTIVENGSLTVRTTTQDRWNNLVNAKTDLRVSTGILTVDTSGLVRATTATRASIVASIAGKPSTDTLWVSVVPAATVAFQRDGRLFTARLDGSERLEIPVNHWVNDVAVQWHPDGQSLVVSMLSPVEYSLSRVTLDGTRTSLLPQQFDAFDLAVPGNIVAYEYSRDGRILYYSAEHCGAVLFRRTTSDVTSFGERLSAPPVPLNSRYGDCIYHHRYPTPSPDGGTLIYENGADDSLWSMDLATHAIARLNVLGHRPRFSPSGAAVAFTMDDRLWLMNPDGGNVRALTPPDARFWLGVNWSPDGRWVIARREGRAVLVEASSGLQIPLPFGFDYLNDMTGLMAWRP